MSCVNFVEEIRSIAEEINLKVKPEQFEAVKQLYGGGDLLVVLLTGFGKSVVFHLLVLVTERILRKTFNTVLVVKPFEIYR